MPTHQPVTSVDLHAHFEGPEFGNETQKDPILEGRVIFVDTKSHTFRFISLNGVVLHDVLYGDAASGGYGEADIPNAGDAVKVKCLYNGKRIYAGRATLPISQGNSTEDKTIFTKKRFGLDRAPGDFFKRVLGGAFIELLRGGIAKFGTSALCQVLFVRSRHLVRLVAHTFEMISSGVRVYISNEDGVIVTRASFFTKDYKGKVFEDDCSKYSNIDTMIDANGLTIQAAYLPSPDVSERKIRATVKLSLDGALTVCLGDQIDPKTGAGKRQELHFGLDHFEHKIFDESGEALYNKSITSSPDTSSVKEWVSGDYELQVGGRLKMYGENGSSFSGDTVQVGDPETIVVETYGTLSNNKASVRS